MTNRNSGVNLELLEGRSFIIGREGHVYVDSTTASKQHARIRIVGGKIHLRDLNSTNGTFLVKDDTRVRFERGFVEPGQAVVIGGKTYVIRDLLAIANDFAVVDNGETELEVPNESVRRASID